MYPVEQNNALKIDRSLDFMQTLVRLVIKNEIEHVINKSVNNFFKNLDVFIKSTDPKLYANSVKTTIDLYKKSSSASNKIDLEIFDMTSLSEITNIVCNMLKCRKEYINDTIDLKKMSPNIQKLNPYVFSSFATVVDYLRIIRNRKLGHRPDYKEETVGYQLSVDVFKASISFISLLKDFNGKKFIVEKDALLQLDAFQREYITNNEYERECYMKRLDCFAAKAEQLIEKKQLDVLRKYNQIESMKLNMTELKKQQQELEQKILSKKEENEAKKQARIAHWQEEYGDLFDKVKKSKDNTHICREEIERIEKEFYKNPMNLFRYTSHKTIKEIIDINFLIVANIFDPLFKKFFQKKIEPGLSLINK
jgi:hypothetical protein